MWIVDAVVAPQISACATCATLGLESFDLYKNTPATVKVPFLTCEKNNHREWQVGECLSQFGVYIKEIAGQALPNHTSKQQGFDFA